MANTKKVMKISSRGRRFAAAMIDSIPVMVLWSTMFGAIVTAIFSSFSYDINSDYSYGAGTVSLISVVLLLAFVIAEIVFYTQGRSIGKALLGMRVVTAKDGKPLGAGWMLFREIIVKQASGVLLLGYIWILIDDYNRSWHDLILQTYVIDDKATKETVAEDEQGAETVNVSAKTYTYENVNPSAEAGTSENVSVSSEGIGIYQSVGVESENSSAEDVLKKAEAKLAFPAASQFEGDGEDQEL